MACGCNVNKNTAEASATGLLKTPVQLRKEHQEAQRKAHQEAQAARQKAHQEAQEAQRKEKEVRLSKKIAEMKTGNPILRKNLKRSTKI
jgi:F0F1-type ATP synthase membrane subunit b/b'